MEKLPIDAFYENYDVPDEAKMLYLDGSKRAGLKFLGVKLVKLLIVEWLNRSYPYATMSRLSFLEQQMRTLSSDIKFWDWECPGSNRQLSKSEQQTELGNVKSALAAILQTNSTDSMKICSSIFVDKFIRKLHRPTLWIDATSICQRAIFSSSYNGETGKQRLQLRPPYKPPQKTPLSSPNKKKRFENAIEAENALHSTVFLSIFNEEFSDSFVLENNSTVVSLHDDKVVASGEGLLDTLGKFLHNHSEKQFNLIEDKPIQQEKIDIRGIWKKIMKFLRSKVPSCDPVDILEIEKEVPDWKELLPYDAVDKSLASTLKSMDPFSTIDIDIINNTARAKFFHKNWNDDLVNNNEFYENISNDTTDIPTQLYASWKSAWTTDAESYRLFQLHTEAAMTRQLKHVKYCLEHHIPVDASTNYVVFSTQELLKTLKLRRYTCDSKTDGVYLIVMRKGTKIPKPPENSSDHLLQEFQQIRRERNNMNDVFFFVKFDIRMWKHTKRTPNTSLLLSVNNLPRVYDHQVVQFCNLLHLQCTFIDDKKPSLDSFINAECDIKHNTTTTELCQSGRLLFIKSNGEACRWFKENLFGELHHPLLQNILLLERTFTCEGIEASQLLNYERQELVGDAVLDLTTAFDICSSFSDRNSEEYNDWHKSATSNSYLKQIFDNIISQDDCSRLSTTLSADNCNEKKHSDVIESLFGALFLSTSIEATHTSIRKLHRSSYCNNLPLPKVISSKKEVDEIFDNSQLASNSFEKPHSPTGMLSYSSNSCPDKIINPHEYFKKISLDCLLQHSSQQIPVRNRPRYSRPFLLTSTLGEDEVKEDTHFNNDCIGLHETLSADLTERSAAMEQIVTADCDQVLNNISVNQFVDEDVILQQSTISQFTTVCSPALLSDEHNEVNYSTPTLCPTTCTRLIAADLSVSISPTGNRVVQLLSEGDGNINKLPSEASLLFQRAEVSSQLEEKPAALTQPLISRNHSNEVHSSQSAEVAGDLVKQAESMHPVGQLEDSKPVVTCSTEVTCALPVNLDVGNEVSDFHYQPAEVIDKPLHQTQSGNQMRIVQLEDSNQCVAQYTQPEELSLCNISRTDEVNCTQTIEGTNSLPYQVPSVSCVPPVVGFQEIVSADLTQFTQPDSLSICSNKLTSHVSNSELPFVDNVPQYHSQLGKDDQLGDLPAASQYEAHCAPKAVGNLVKQAGMFSADSLHPVGQLEDSKPVVTCSTEVTCALPVNLDVGNEVSDFHYQPAEVIDKPLHQTQSGNQMRIDQQEHSNQCVAQYTQPEELSLCNISRTDEVNCTQTIEGTNSLPYQVPSVSCVPPVVGFQEIVSADVTQFTQPDSLSICSNNLTSHVSNSELPFVDNVPQYHSQLGSNVCNDSNHLINVPAVQEVIHQQIVPFPSVATIAPEDEIRQTVSSHSSEVLTQVTQSGDFRDPLPFNVSYPVHDFGSMQRADLPLELIHNKGQPDYLQPQVAQNIINPLPERYDNQKQEFTNSTQQVNNIEMVNPDVNMSSHQEVGQVELNQPTQSIHSLPPQEVFEPNRFSQYVRPEVGIPYTTAITQQYSTQPVFVQPESTQPVLNHDCDFKLKQTECCVNNQSVMQTVNPVTMNVRYSDGMQSLHSQSVDSPQGLSSNDTLGTFDSIPEQDFIKTSSVVELDNIQHTTNPQYDCRYDYSNPSFNNVPLMSEVTQHVKQSCEVLQCAPVGQERSCVLQSEYYPHPDGTQYLQQQHPVTNVDYLQPNSNIVDSTSYEVYEVLRDVEIGTLSGHASLIGETNFQPSGGTSLSGGFDSSLTQSNPVDCIAAVNYIENTNNYHNVSNLPNCLPVTDVNFRQPNNFPDTVQDNQSNVLFRDYSDNSIPTISTPYIPIMREEVSASDTGSNVPEISMTSNSGIVSSPLNQMITSPHVFTHPPAIAQDQYGHSNNYFDNSMPCGDGSIPAPVDQTVGATPHSGMVSTQLPAIVQDQGLSQHSHSNNYSDISISETVPLPVNQTMSGEMVITQTDGTPIYNNNRKEEIPSVIDYNPPSSSGVFPAVDQTMSVTHEAAFPNTVTSLSQCDGQSHSNNYSNEVVPLLGNQMITSPHVFTHPLAIAQHQYGHSNNYFDNSMPCGDGSIPAPVDQTVGATPHSGMVSTHLPAIVQDQGLHQYNSHLSNVGNNFMTNCHEMK